MHPSSLKGIDDMTNLSDLHEASILRNLKLRFEEDKIYVRFIYFFFKSNLNHILIFSQKKKDLHRIDFGCN